jgi:hypothetical protein
MLYYIFEISRLNINNFMSNDLDTLLNEIGSYKTVNKPIPIKDVAEDTVPPTDDNLNDYILKQASELVDISVSSVKELKDFVLQGTNPEEITALAELVNASTRAIEAINKLNLQKKKHKNDIDIKTLDHEFKKRLLEINPKPQTVNNTVLIASREEIFKKFINKEQDELPLEVVETQSIIAHSTEIDN